MEKHKKLAVTEEEKSINITVWGMFLVYLLQNAV